LKINAQGFYTLNPSCFSKQRGFFIILPVLTGIIEAGLPLFIKIYFGRMGIVVT
jgi:hypothetical protein